MNARYHLPLRVAAVSAACAVIGVVAATPAGAAGNGDVKVVNTETVQVYTSPSGQVQTRRVYEQLALTGHGRVDLSNPVSTDHLRNLDGFSGFTVKDGRQVTTADVSGEKRLRSVSDYDGNLPLDVSVAYKLDGKNVEPGEVVGKSGHLEVTYTVRNVTAKPQQLTFDDGNGGTVTKTVQVPIPIVGSLTTTAPAGFTNVASESANMGGDGKGGTQLSFTMTLFPPIGSDTAVFGYSADVTDAVIPRATVSALPVNPLASPTFKSAAGSYKGGADTGAELADGAGQIDENLLKLRDGASQLLAGLIQLRDGAGQLETGLAGQAVPGAHKLADGAGQLDAGLGRLHSGARRLAAGAGEAYDGSRQLSAGAAKLDAGASDLAVGSKRLHVGTGSALEGGQTLTAGLKQISGGLSQLADGTSGLPSAKAGIAALQAGVDQILAGFGDASDPNTLIGGLTALSAGLGTAQSGAGQLAGGLQVLRGNGSTATPGLFAAQAGVNTVKDGIQAGLEDTTTLTLLQAVAAACGSTNYACLKAVGDLGAQLTTSQAGLQQAVAGLAAVSTGLGQAIDALDTQLIPGAGQLAAGIGAAKTGADKLTAGATQAKGGLTQVRGGLDTLVTGVESAVGGVLQLSAGAQQAYAGSDKLTSGLGALDSGAGQLADGSRRLAQGTHKLAAGADDLSTGLGKLHAGAGKLAAGATDAKDGSGKIAKGANDLATGLEDAANGSSRLKAGLSEAADGAPKLVDGAQRLSDEGTKKLVDAGKSTAQSYGEMYATMTAGAERAKTESMAFGAPEGAVGLTAYNYVIQGDDGEGGRNWTRGVGGLAILGAGAGAFALRRRMV